MATPLRAVADDTKDTGMGHHDGNRLASALRRYSNATLRLRRYGNDDLAWMRGHAAANLLMRKLGYFLPDSNGSRRKPERKQTVQLSTAAHVWVPMVAAASKLPPLYKSMSTVSKAIESAKPLLLDESPSTTPYSNAHAAPFEPECHQRRGCWAYLACSTLGQMFWLNCLIITASSKVPRQISMVGHWMCVVQFYGRYHLASMHLPADSTSKSNQVQVHMILSF